MPWIVIFFFFQAEDGIRYLVRSRGLGDVYKRQPEVGEERRKHLGHVGQDAVDAHPNQGVELLARELSLIHI